MSWADDIRCLYCDGRLPLYRKITNGQFCTSAHRKAYWQEHERLAVERLHQTHDSLRAYRPPGAVEAILGPAAAAEDDAAQDLAAFLSPVTDSPNADAIDSRPQWSPQSHVYTEIAEPALGKLIPPPIFRLPKFLPDYVAIVDVHPVECSNRVQFPVIVRTLQDYTLVSAPVVPIAGPEPRRSAESLAAQSEALYPNVDAAHPVLNLHLEIAGEIGAQDDELRHILDQESPLDQGIPEVAGTIALSQFEPHAFATASIAEVLPAGILPRAHLPLNRLRLEASLYRGTLLHAGLSQLPVSNTPVTQSAVSQDGLRAIDLRASQAPQLSMSSSSGLTPRLPRLNLAAGSRYQVQTRSAGPIVPVTELESFATAPPQISLPARTVKVMKAAAGASVSRTVEAAPQAPLNLEFEPALNPSAMGMLPLACTAQPSQPSIDMRPAPAALSLPQPLEPKPMRPDSKLEPLDEKPTSDAIAASQPMRPPQTNLDSHINVWMHALDFAKRAPRDLKMLVFAIPVLLALALHPALPKVRVAAPAAANGIERNVTRAFGDQWKNVRQTMVDRAAVALDEDFRQGLDDWTSRGDATADWSFDATGFVRPGPLAVYRPTMNLTDYQMQFLGVLDKQALSWVVRAADYDNFYVIKLTTLKSGPLPTIGVVRYAVVNGKADTRVDTIAPLDARADMLYRVRVDVRGDDFALSVQGQMVDSWTEPRLKRGGIGFFSARGEESRLRWVQVTHQYDMLGRLCAYLAPYNIPTTGGSWQQ
jgi:hypothetical protein